MVDECDFAADAAIGAGSASDGEVPGRGLREVGEELDGEVAVGERIGGDAVVDRRQAREFADAAIEADLRVADIDVGCEDVLVADRVGRGVGRGGGVVEIEDDIVPGGPRHVEDLDARAVVARFVRADLGR